jgi:putative DNA primase/helicase
MVTPNGDEFQAALRASVEGLAVALLGEPTKRLTDHRSMKWGEKGSLTLSLQGSKRGSWFNHEAGYGGGPLQLIVHARFCSYHDAEEWAREWLSLPREKRGAYTGVHPAAALLAGLADATGPDADDAKRIATAQRLWKASAPVAGTLGEHYLTAHRGIPCPSHGWPGAVRFHPDSRAFIVAATLPDGTVQAVQRVRLTAGGAKISREEIWSHAGRSACPGDTGPPGRSESRRSPGPRCGRPPAPGVSSREACAPPCVKCFTATVPRFRSRFIRRHGRKPAAD